MNKYDKKHLKNLEALDRLIKRIMLKAAEDAARIGARIDELLDQEKLFSFDDYPSVKPEVEKLLKKLEEQLEVAIVNGVDSAWTLSNNKNDELSRRVFGDNVGELSQADYNRYFSNNNEAREAFKQRKTEGLNLSDRVWNCTKDFKAQIELGLNVGIRNGTSAVDMAQELKQWLVHPDKLFRKVRDEQGLLQLSENAKAFHPGRGVYRSSYMNARRLAATETNIAYRTADHLRWQQMDFVVGIEICLSNNHTIRLQPGETTDDPTQLRKDGTPKANAVRPLHDICDDLKGRYPKTFKFTGWHPHCRCYAVSILKTDEELAKDNERILNGEEPIEGSVNEMKDVPEGFKKWLEENEERISKHKSVPYFLKDNTKYTGVRTHKSGVGAFTGTKLGRAATKEAFKEYENDKPTSLTKEQKVQTAEIARTLGLKEHKPMTFFEADEGRANVNFGKDEAFSDNCQCCVAIHEARLRGLDLTAIGYSAKKDSMTFMLGENFQDIWVNAKTGKTPQVTMIKAEAEEALFNKLEKSLESTGRYHIGINQTNNRGHVITAERLQSGKLLFYDPQNGNFMNIREYSDLESFEVLKVDKLLFKPEMLRAISQVIK